ncbi:hypothetical protein BS50DRAFT_384690 [Corynespora cassiicola Philippines]|uniref:Uncharacterized protein n=1 Tax=Corynespora cassiicola Philippines TaxID=1448308 RepID=A0A2T2NP47_CORCC|nr:hypothetical protein BS50DRAFT_384690 [Corynespora cassiicola Philippines]
MYHRYTGRRELFLFLPRFPTARSAWCCLQTCLAPRPGLAKWTKAPPLDCADSSQAQLQLPLDEALHSSNSIRSSRLSKPSKCGAGIKPKTGREATSVGTL